MAIVHLSNISKHTHTKTYRKSHYSSKRTVQTALTNMRIAAALSDMHSFLSAIISEAYIYLFDEA